MNDIDIINKRIDKLEEHICVLASSFFRTTNLSEITISEENYYLVRFLVEHVLTTIIYSSANFNLDIKEVFEVSAAVRASKSDNNDIDNAVKYLSNNGLRIRCVTKSSDWL